MSERDPLLQRDSEQVAQVDEAIQKTGTERRKLGPREIDKWQRYSILAGIWSATFLSTLNQTLVPTMLPSISSEFHKSHQASWLGTSYLLATCTFTPLYGRLCDVLGRKHANQTAVLFAGVGVLLCGLSTNMEMLIMARFFAGIGGGGLLTTASIIVSDMYSIRSRGLTQGVASIFNGLGQGLGGPLGGLITDWLGWRWAFLIQIPLFVASFLLTEANLTYVTAGKGKSPKEMLKRIDFLGSGCLMVAVGATLVFLSARYNADLPFSDPSCLISFCVAILFGMIFIVVELYVSVEPVMTAVLLKQRIPVLIGISNFLVPMCNFSVMYFFPMYFQTVMLTNASTAGLHLLPNSLSMSVGSVFAGWMMHKTGTYKMINMIFGAFPFIGAVTIYNLKEDSGFFQSWFGIIPLGFGNAVLLQTMLIALLVHIPDEQMAVGTGFVQLFRGVGQVGGVAIASAIFQSDLDYNLRQRIHGPNAEETIRNIRQNARIIGSLDPPLQRIAKDSYNISIHRVFLFAAVSTFLAYIVRLPIPDKHLERRAPAEPPSPAPSTLLSRSNTPVKTVSEDEDHGSDSDSIGPKGNIPSRRRLSTYENATEVLSDFATLQEHGQTGHTNGPHGQKAADQKVPSPSQQ